MAEQPSLHLEAVGIACEAAILADDAVAGDDDRNRIEAIGVAYGAGGIVMVDYVCDIAVCPCTAVWDEFDHLPDFLVKIRGIAKVELEVKFLECSCEVGGELLGAGFQAFWYVALFAMGIFRTKTDAADAFVGSFEVDRTYWGRDDRVIGH